MNEEKEEPEEPEPSEPDPDLTHIITEDDKPATEKRSE